ncbi:MAG: glucose 1-dehydrogenase [Oscillospiraceae bacterium]|nr:glucose 1-dehydrogenase [Oscillospiraceae bacterium]
MKTVLITGASGGIGAAIAREMSRAGYNIALTYNKNKEKAENLCAEMGNAQAFHCDISSFESVEKLYSDVLSAFGRIDAVVNNAGTAFTGLVQDMTEAEILHLVNTDLNGVIYSTKFAANHMVKNHSGVIVNISSIWGVVGASCEAVYSAAKGGVVTFTKAMAKEIGPSGVRVNCVSPGVIKTAMLDRYTDEDLQALADETPLGRIGMPQDVAKAVKFLISDDAAFITGQNIVVDGGISL